MQYLKIKIVVCTLGRKTLAACLGALPQRDGLQVVIVNQSGRELPDIPEGSIVINTPPVGLSAARNMAISAAPGGDYYVFIDDDAVPASDYFDRLIEYLSAAAPDAVAGAIIRAEDGEYYSKVHESKSCRLNMRDWNKFMGGNFVVGKRVFDLVGTFDVRFGAGEKWGCGEETDLFFRMMYGGMKVSYYPGIKVTHPKEPLDSPTPAFLERIHLYGKGHGALFAKHLLQYKNLSMAGRYLWSLAKPLARICQFAASLNRSKIALYKNILSGRIYGFKEYLLD